MKLTILFTVAFLNVHANSLSQTITLSAKNLSLKKIFTAIEKQTDYVVFSSNSVLEKAKPVSFEVVNMPLEYFLQLLVKDQPLSYKIVDKTIIISQKLLPTVLTDRTSAPDTSALSQPPPIDIKGKIVNNSGEPVARASIKVKNSDIGTTSDDNGEFLLKNIDENAILVISFVGFNTQEIAIKNKSSLHIQLVPSESSLDQVVVIGYGTQKKSEVTTAIASVKSKDFVKGAVNDAGQLLQGKVAGLTVVPPGGDPTATSQILLRGTATISTSTQPLVLVDGIPGDLNTVAPEDIESMDVLKDGSAAAIYGTRGTNGVILITTRRAKGNIEPTLDYNAYVSTQVIARKPELLTAEDYKRLINDGVGFNDRGSSTDWIKEITRTPISQVHNLSFRGGNAKTNYIATGTYRSLQGIMKKSDNRKLIGRIDLNHNMFDNKLRFNIGLISSDQKYQTTANGSSFDTYIYRQALNRNPTEPVKNPDGTWYERPDLYLYDNPLGRIYESDGETSAITNRLNASISWLPVAGLTLKVLGSQQVFNELSGYAENKKHISNLRDHLNGFASRGTYQGTDRLLELTADFSKTSGLHSYSVLAGYSYQEAEGESFYMDNYDFPTDAFSYNNMEMGNALNIGRAYMSSDKFENNLIGFFGRVTYSYDQKYLVMANLRREASSKLLGANEPWGTFPSVSAGWRINRESFMRNAGFVNELKLRVGYGVTGTSPDASFLGVSRLRYAGYFLNNGTWTPTIVPASNENPFLRWEEKHETNIGLDFTLFKSRVSGTIDLYRRETRGLLYNYPVPSPPNLYNETTANVGKMENKGLEIILNFIPVQARSFVWNTSVIFSTNKNKLVSLENELYKLTNNFFDAGYLNDAGGITHRVQVGESIGNFFGFKVVDVDDQGKWIFNSPSKGLVHYDDFEFSEEDKVILGNGLPKYYAGWNNNFRYKNFDLNVTMRGAFGFQILNSVRVYYENPAVTNFNQLKSAHDKVFGKAVLNVPSVEWNSYYVENGDYWKIDNITLGYNFSSPLFRYLKNPRLYISSLNTFTITNYKGIDPEVNRLGLSPGIDERDRYPSVRTFTFGLSVNF